MIKNAITNNICYGNSIKFSVSIVTQSNVSINGRVITRSSACRNVNEFQTALQTIILINENSSAISLNFEDIVRIQSDSLRVSEICFETGFIDYIESISLNRTSITNISNSDSLTTVLSTSCSGSNYVLNLRTYESTLSIDCCVTIRVSSKGQRTSSLRSGRSGDTSSILELNCSSFRGSAEGDRATVNCAQKCFLRKNIHF